jgi:Na+-translocating ferredoxin:NAD+ oxidoreductase subunit G
MARLKKAGYGFIILALICIVPVFALAEEQAAFKEVLPSAVKFREVRSAAHKEILYYRALDNQDKLIGFIFEASGKGYSGIITTLVGIFPDGKISAIKVISLNETPGLGMRVTESKFTDQFKNQNSLDLTSVEAVTGATISSRAVMNAVMKKAQEIRELIKNEK